MTTDTTEPMDKPLFDRSYRFDADGRPKRPIDDALTARYMLARGFSRDDVVHLIGYLPDHEAVLGPLEATASTD